MNNTAERAEAGQQSHPLPPDGRKTNALLRDRMRPGLVCRQNLLEELDWLVAWPEESCLSVYLSRRPDHLSKSLQMQQPGSTFVMTTCFRDTLI